MSSSFYAYIDRMKYIDRWGLMRNIRRENDMEHSMQVTLLAHGIALVALRRCGVRVDLGKVALMAAYHDVQEVMTGDLATPVKYSDPVVRDAFHGIESAAADRLLAMAPADLRPDLETVMRPDTASREWRIVKAADKLSAWLKCLEETKAGNTEFSRARETIAAQLKAFDLPELGLFMEEFCPAFELTLDELESAGG